MTRLFRVIRHEWRLFLSDRTGLLTAILLGIAVSYGVWNGARWVRFEHRTIQAALEVEAKTLSTQRRDATAILEGRAEGGSFTDPTSPGVVGGTFGGGRYAVLPPGPLAALSVGQSDLHPSYVRVSLQPIQNVLSRDEIENPQTLLLGRFDFAFVVVYLLPLVIISLSYQLLSGEREEGTLALLLSQPIALATVLSGKVLARLLLLLGIVGLVVILASAVGGIDARAQGAMERLSLITLTIVTYAFLWFGLAVLVNTLGWSSAANAIVLLAAWLAVVVVIPSSVNVVAGRLYPAPSRVELIQAMRRATDDADTHASQLLGKYFQDHPDLVPASANASMSDFYSRTIAVQSDAEAAARPVMNRFATQTEAQRRLVDRLQFLSPSVLTRSALDTLAGTSEERYRDFVRQIEAYHTRWRAFFVPRIMRQAKMTAVDYDQIPVFEYASEAEREVRARVWRSIAGLGAPLILVTLAAGFLSGRYRPVG